MLSIPLLFFLVLSSNAEVAHPGLPPIPTPTPHIKAQKGDFAKTVLMPGDPLRAQYIAEKYLTNAQLVNNVRGVQGYTGEYKGKRVSVMASGMGIPSIGIYSYELYNAFDVDNIIRIGSSGSIHESVTVKDIIVATGASTNSNYGSDFIKDAHISAVASYSLLKKADDAAKKLGLEKKVHFGQLLTSDHFYTEEPGYDMQFTKMGALGVEMEAYGLYLNAARANKNALAICTVSDDLLRNKYLSSDERQFGFDEMILLALEMVD